ncbi:shikimate dehydrogenase family protein [Pedobacter flavus]|uniref:Shikimate dehydrogenase n=1 Tax=Pedobacter flavus TaxID=3113906 RepID=A0ABU7GZU4_9SPHI|nr:shikimate dehydrogenase [Pedobacter sp. VNH31]MEE1884591.1 shikimate dehydrogenase [Pedobacter sp. VNH31]
MEKKYGLIGFPLSHSFSKKYFEKKFSENSLKDFSYDSFEMERLNNFNNFLNLHPNLFGFNVTIPHKENIIPFLDTIDNAALKIGAVNCVKVKKINGVRKLLGFNTDCIGFKSSLAPLLTKNHTHALILGSGGASKSVQYVLKELNISFLVVSRTSGDIKYQDLNQSILEKYLLIINTTPLGMYPNITEQPSIDYNFITSKHLVYDLIYNPEQTLFLENCANMGAKTKNGYEMLVLQAEESWRIWQDANL